MYPLCNRGMPSQRAPGDASSWSKSKDRLAALLDQYPTRFLLACAAVAVLFGVGDFLTTTLGIMTFGPMAETNALVRSLVTEGGVSLFFYAKVFATAAIIATAATIYGESPRLSELSLWGIAGFGLFLTLHNLLALLVG